MLNLYGLLHNELFKLKKRQERFDTKVGVTLLPSPEFVDVF
jgi:hypothetical protein